MSTKSKKAAPPSAIVETVVEAVAEKVSETAEKVTKAATANHKAAKETAVKTTAAVMKGYEEVASMGQANFDLIVKANTIVAKGFEEMSKELMSYAQTSMASAATAAKALIAAKTLQDVVEVNNDFAKASIDGFLAQSSKLSEMSVKVANEAMAPISSQVTQAMDKLAKPVAA